MSRKYRHISEYETEIISMVNQGLKLSVLVYESIAFASCSENDALFNKSYSLLIIGLSVLNILVSSFHKTLSLFHPIISAM